MKVLPVYFFEMRKPLMILILLSAMVLVSACEGHLEAPREAAPPESALGGVQVDELAPGADTYLEARLLDPQLAAFISKRGLQSRALHRVTAPSGYVFYGVALSAGDGATDEEPRHYLAFYPGKGAEHRQILYQRTPAGQGMETLELINPLTERRLHATLLSIPLEELDYRSTCEELFDTFNGCMECAVDQLTGDWLSFAACSLAGWGPCLAAAGIHCL